MNTYIEDFFAYLDKFEARAGFDSEAFLQTYNGVYTVFGAMRDDRPKAIELDQLFVTRIKQTPLGQSDLRQLAVQVLISFFETEADIDGQSNQGYLYCRSLREVRQDVPYFESHLVPLLFREGALGGDQRLVAFFLGEIARYMNRYGHRLDAELKPEMFDAMTEPSRYLHLERRRLAMGKDLATDRASLEFHLLQVNAFAKMAARGKVQRALLSDWGYLRTTSFWSKLATAAHEFIGKLGGAFSNWKYFRLVMTQRNSAYLTYSVVIIICIILAIYIPMKWKSYSDSKFEQLNSHAQELQQKSSNK